jgi:hypothetical protein
MASRRPFGLDGEAEVGAFAGAVAVAYGGVARLPMDGLSTRARLTSDRPDRDGGRGLSAMALSRSSSRRAFRRGCESYVSAFRAAGGGDVEACGKSKLPERKGNGEAGRRGGMDGDGRVSHGQADVPLSMSCARPAVGICSPCMMAATCSL